MTSRRSYRRPLRRLLAQILAHLHIDQIESLAGWHRVALIVPCKRTQQSQVDGTFYDGPPEGQWRRWITTHPYFIVGFETDELAEIERQPTSRRALLGEEPEEEVFEKRRRDVVDPIAVLAEAVAPDAVSQIRLVFVPERKAHGELHALLRGDGRRVTDRQGDHDGQPEVVSITHGIVLPFSLK